ncbi:hypothetical protein LCGC14_0859860 [marine sediment metagenome]|uniref:Uncharacterized protein n=1 Tax=marine sediment metagenome TaxID=412755 RepID=A0A0F9RSE8_9ZZZZ
MSDLAYDVLSLIAVAIWVLAFGIHMNRRVT